MSLPLVVQVASTFVGRLGAFLLSAAGFALMVAILFWRPAGKTHDASGGGACRTPDR